jgi:hypothetical protein
MDKQPKGSESMKNNYLITVVLVVVFAGVAFFGGMKYQQSKQSSLSGRFTAATGGQLQRQGSGSAAGRNGSGMQPVNGQIISSSDNSITVQMQDGSSKIVLVTDKTVINKADQASRGDLATGAKVAVFGQTNSDGSVTAQNIQLNPLARSGQAPGQN